VFSGYLGVYAAVVSRIVRLFDSSVHAVGPQVIGRFSIKIGRGCDAMETHFLCAAAVIAFPATWRQRLVGLLAGFGIIALANVIRLCVLYYVGTRWPTAFYFAHVELAPIVLIVIAIGAFLVWIRWTGRHPTDPRHAGA
jgi:exosortase/archaeosortase family protein